MDFGGVFSISPLLPVGGCLGLAKGRVCLTVLVEAVREIANLFDRGVLGALSGSTCADSLFFCIDAAVESSNGQHARAMYTHDKIVTPYLYSPSST